MDCRINKRREVRDTIQPRRHNLDLNLLTVFDLLLRAQAIPGTVRLPGMSQPALSHAVTRL